MGELLCADLVPLIAAQAAEADRTRTVAPDVIAAIKASPLMAMAATPELGGLGTTIGDIARELEVVAAACGSTAWCLWNHLCVFHLYVGTLGPPNAELLASIVERHEWVCFPAGAGSQVYGRLDRPPTSWSSTGSTTFGSGSRYAEWTAVVAADGRPSDRRADLAARPALHRRAPRRAERARRSDVGRDGPAGVGHRHRRTTPGRGCRRRAASPWYAANRADVLRRLDHDVMHPRYREDWVGLSDLWLAAQATGAAGAAIEEAADGVRGRRAIMGAKMVDLPMVPMRLGEAAAMVATARAAVTVGCAEVDERIAAGIPPTEADHTRQLALAAQALRLCRDAMDHVLIVLGGNGLREGGSFERRYRDVTAMPLHINAHPDRVYDKVGRQLIGVPPVTKF